MSFKRVQEMESDSRAQQREQETLLAAVCQTLKEEHMAKQKDVTQVEETQKVDEVRGSFLKKS